MKTLSSSSPAAPRRGAAAFWIILVTWVLILGLIAGVLYGLAAIYRGDRILAGANALGQDLAGLPPAEAAARLNAAWASRQIVLDAGEQSWSLAPAQLGILLDANAMAQAAFRQGRDTVTLAALPSLAQRLLATVGLGTAPAAAAVPPAWRFDAEVAAATLRTLAAQLAIEPHNAGIRVAEGRIETTPSAPGRAADIAALLAALEQQPWDQSLARPAAPPIRFAVPLVSRAPAVTDVSGIEQELTPLLANPITIGLYDAVRDERATWTVAPAEIGGWLDFAADPEGKLSWTLNEDRAAAFIADRNKSFGDERYVKSEDVVPALADAFKNRRPEIRLRVSHAEREHIVRAGETLSSIADEYGMPYGWLIIANHGISDTIYVGDRLKIPSQDELLPLPVVENKRIKVSIARQRVQVYEAGQLKWDWPASTGLPESPTSPGIFQVQSHEELAYAAVWNLYMPWFMGIYQPIPGQAFMNGFHGFPSRDRKQFLWERNLGRPITYGCILISTTNAKLLYDWAEAGVVVEITP